jgi:hypothetical protein
MMRPRHWLDRLPALNGSGVHEAVAACSGSYQSSRGWNFSRNSYQRVGQSELCQRV